MSYNEFCIVKQLFSYFSYYRKSRFNNVQAVKTSSNVCATRATNDCFFACQMVLLYMK